MVLRGGRERMAHYRVKLVYSLFVVAIPVRHIDRLIHEPVAWVKSAGT